MKFIAFLLFIAIFMSNTYAEINYTQLAYNIRNYAILIENQACLSKDIPDILPTDGLDQIDIALNNPEFLHQICVNSHHYKECVNGSFSVITEFSGFRNGILSYNENHTNNIGLMICSSVAYVDMYSKEYSDKI